MKDADRATHIDCLTIRMLRMFESLAEQPIFDLLGTSWRMRPVSIWQRRIDHTLAPARQSDYCKSAG
jgi:hypothetical protein